jgi:hypothetical protein
MKKSLLSVALGFCLALAGCSPYTLVNSETYNDADLAAYHTFRIVAPDGSKGCHLPEGMQMVTYYNIAAAIREQMVHRGYVESATAALVVNFGITVHHEVETAPAPPPMVPMGPAGFPGPGPMGGFYPSFVYPRSYYWNPNAQVITGVYKEGVLTVDMVNIDTKVALFSASVATVMDGSQGQYRNLSGIAEAVQTLFSKFPVPLLPQYRSSKSR